MKKSDCSIYIYICVHQQHTFLCPLALSHSRALHQSRILVFPIGKWARTGKLWLFCDFNFCFLFRLFFVSRALFACSLDYCSQCSFVRFVAVVSHISIVGGKSQSSLAFQLAWVWEELTSGCIVWHVRIYWFNYEIRFPLMACDFWGTWINTLILQRNAWLSKFYCNFCC